MDSAPDIASPSLKTTSLSSYPTWHLSEFNRLRFQYTYGWDDTEQDKGVSGNQIFLQWTTTIGTDSDA